MAKKYTAALPAGLDLPDGWTVTLTALDPTAGTLVAGCKVSNVVIMGTTAIPATADQPPGFTPVPPIWLPEQLDQTPVGP